jgi:hypothetical protein
MLAEIFMLQLQWLLRANESRERLPTSNAPFVPIAPKHG